MIAGRAFVLCAVCGCACRALCRRTRILIQFFPTGTLCGFQRGQAVRVSLPDLGAQSGNGCDVAPVWPISYREKQAPAHLCARKHFRKFQKRASGTNTNTTCKAKKARNHAEKQNFECGHRGKFPAFAGGAAVYTVISHRKKLLHSVKTPPSRFEIRVFCG